MTVGISSNYIYLWFLKHLTYIKKMIYIWIKTLLINPQ